MWLSCCLTRVPMSRRRINLETHHCISLVFGHVGVVKMLLKKDADVDAKDGHGWTSLHKASKNGHIDAVKVLPGKGADVDARNCNRSTPLHGASE